MQIDEATIEQMQSDIRRILSILDSNGGFTHNELVLGRFQPGEQIQMCDRQLYDGNGSPFTNYQQMARAKKKGCPFATPDTIKQWSIKAEDLRDWLTASRTKTELINLK